MKRETYIDNNGFIRYEDTCKIVPNQTDNKDVLSEMYKIFGKHSKANKNYDFNYEIDRLNYLEGRCLNDIID